MGSLDGGYANVGTTGLGTATAERARPPPGLRQSGTQCAMFMRKTSPQDAGGPKKMNRDRALAAPGNVPSILETHRQSSRNFSQGRNTSAARLPAALAPRRSPRPSLRVSMRPGPSSRGRSRSRSRSRRRRRRRSSSRVRNPDRRRSRHRALSRGLLLLLLPCKLGSSSNITSISSNRACRLGTRPGGRHRRALRHGPRRRHRCRHRRRCRSSRRPRSPLRRSRRGPGRGDSSCR